MKAFMKRFPSGKIRRVNQRNAPWLQMTGEFSSRAHFCVEGDEHEFPCMSEEVLGPWEEYQEEDETEKTLHLDEDEEWTNSVPMELSNYMDEVGECNKTAMDDFNVDIKDEDYNVQKPSNDISDRIRAARLKFEAMSDEEVLSFIFKAIDSHLSEYEE